METLIRTEHWYWWILWCHQFCCDYFLPHYFVWVISVVIFFAVKEAVAIPGLFKKSFIKNKNGIFAYIVKIRWLLANIQNQWEYWRQVCHLELDTVGTPVWCSKFFLAPNRSLAWQHDFLWLKDLSKISLSTKIYHSYTRMCLDLQKYNLAKSIFLKKWNYNMPSWLQSLASGISKISSILWMSQDYIFVLLVINHNQ